MENEFNTLRGAQNGTEPEEEVYFAFSASLRIFGDIPDVEQISAALGIQPTHEDAEPYRQDMWWYSPTLDESEALEKHIDALWEKLKPHKAYLMELKRAVTVDVFLGYRSNCDHAGIEVPHTSLEMFRELEIPFGVSIIIA
jgi:hypothetical protein